MKTSVWILFCAALIALSLAGCEPAQTPVPLEQPTQPPNQEPTAVPPAATSTPAPTPTPAAVLPEIMPEALTPTTEADAGSVEAGLDSDVAAAKADLAQRITVAAESIEVLSANSVTWADGSIGCPKPGILYTMATVHGLLIRLQANGTVYEYHSGGNGAPFYCEKPVQPINPVE